MNAVLGRMASTAQELSHYHSGEGNIFLLILILQGLFYFNLSYLYKFMVVHFK